MDTDGGDNPGNTLICHTVLRAYLRCEQQGGRAFLRLHTRFQITEKELPYIVNHYLHCYNDCLPDPLRLFFGDGNGFFLCEHNAAQDPCREGKQTGGTGL